MDLHQPLPDRAHDALRVAVVQALTDLTQTTVDLEDGFSLADVALELIDSLFALVDDQAARLTDLEAAITPLPGPDAAG